MWEPKAKGWSMGKDANSSALWPLPSGGAGNCLLPLLCNPASITLLNPWRKQLQKKIFVLWQAHVCTFPALEVLIKPVFCLFDLLGVFFPICAATVPLPQEEGSVRTLCVFLFWRGSLSDPREFCCFGSCNVKSCL